MLNGQSLLHISNPNEDYTFKSIQSFENNYYIVREILQGLRIGFHKVPIVIPQPENGNRLRLINKLQIIINKLQIKN